MIYLQLPRRCCCAPKIFSKSSPLRNTTYTRTAGFCLMNNPEFRPVARQNPPVLQPLETVCSVSKHPLSSGSGRRRYNTLDFPTENRVPTGRFRPYWKPGSQGTCSPFTIPARLCICIYKLTKSFLHTYPQTKKSPEFSSKKERNSLGIFRCRIHSTGRHSCVT